MQLHDFFDYKNQLMEDLLTNETIVGLLKDGATTESAEELMYTQVFPYEYVPETVEHGDTFICCDVDVSQSLNKTYLLPVIYIWVFSHRSKLRLPEGGVRPDKICAEICDAINGSRKYGLGELDLYAVKRFAPMTDYQGKCMIFHAVEFNRQYDPLKFTPSNRKHN